MKQPFEYQKPTEGQVDHITAVRHGFHLLWDIVQGHVPPGRERALVLTKLQEASMWANAGIVFGEELPPFEPQNWQETPSGLVKPIGTAEIEP